MSVWVVSNVSSEHGHGVLKACVGVEHGHQVVTTSITRAASMVEFYRERGAASTKWARVWALLVEAKSSDAGRCKQGHEAVLAFSSELRQRQAACATISQCVCHRGRQALALNTSAGIKWHAVSEQRGRRAWALDSLMV